MRTWLVLGLLLAAPLAVAEDGECTPETTSFHPADDQHVWLDIEERDCENGSSLDISEQDPDGRTHLEWYDDDRGGGFAIYRSPRFFYWAEDDRGCIMAFSVFGAMEFGCPLGPPPTPLALP